MFLIEIRNILKGIFYDIYEKSKNSLNSCLGSSEDRVMQQSNELSERQSQV